MPLTRATLITLALCLGVACQKTEGTTSPEQSATSQGLALPSAAPSASSGGEATPLRELSCKREDPPAGKRPWHIGKPSKDADRNAHRATLDLESYPEARCNDGSPGVVYLREGRGADRDKWIVHLQGGGACRGYASCRDRRCGVNTNFDVTKMSSRWAPKTMEPHGIFQRGTAKRGVENRFAGYNVAFIYYCSSDSYVGRKSGVVLAGDDGGALRADFQGHNIIAAVLETLREGARSDDGSMTMPTLDDASRVLFTGISAGSNGVRANADWFTATVRESNADAEVFAVADAAFTPRRPEGSQDELAAYAETVAEFDEAVDAHVDASCREHHGDDPSVCTDRFHLTLNHVTTPTFLRMDYVDPLPMRKQAEIWGGKRVFAEKIRTAMTQFAALKEKAEEGDAVTKEPGVFGTTCKQHVYLDISSFFFGAKIEQDGGTYNFHDLLNRWLDGDGPRVVLDGLAKKDRRMRCPKRVKGF